MISEFPEVFTNKCFEYKPCDIDLAHCDGLMGWALCMSGNHPPENFGNGMIKIGKLLGITPQHENLMQYSNKKS